ncbi:hypothetical protein SLS60_008411 [Paraconiothyrium brasiliense]|uniref:Uncharacterized protein n=1 Tax=Paraconiothyrium brasiliense TaxID=300254 RepID=A0ABR3R0H7_9PLEO
MQFTAILAAFAFAASVSAEGYFQNQCTVAGGPNCARSVGMTRSVRSWISSRSVEVARDAQEETIKVDVE